jgi:hypothetical protein
MSETKRHSEGGTMILLRAHRDRCPLRQSAEALEGFVVEGEDGGQRGCRVGCPVRSSRNGAPEPPVAGSIEEALETAAAVGFPGGQGGSINREE